MKLLKSHFLLVLLVVLVTFGHFYKLGQVPKILNPDEASIAYNALLLKETGKDEWGKTWPLVLEAFGDQKLIGYPALVVIAFHFFGYADWVVKLPSLLAGSCLVILAYVLQKQIGRTKKEALLTAFMVGIVPVFFFYSRVAFESMVALTCLLSGISLFLYSQKQKRTQGRILSELGVIALFAASLLTYNSPVLLIPLVLLSFVLSQGVYEWKKWTRVVFAVAAIWLVFFVYFLPLTKQKSKITLFGDETTLQQYGEYRSHFAGISQSILGNKYLFFAEKMGINYLNSWSPSFLMQNKGGHPWHAVQGFGYLSWSIFVLGLIGIGLTIFELISSAIKRKQINKNQLSFLFLFLTSLLPAIITVNAPQATRSLLFFFLWCFYAAFALIKISNYLGSFSKHKAKAENLIFLVVVLAILLEATQYFTFYFGKYANDNQLQSMFQPGFDTLIQHTDVVYSTPMAIVDERGFDYILAAWYLKTSPSMFFSTIKKQQPDKINFKYGEQLGKYHFIAKPIDRRAFEKVVLEWNSGQNKWDTLYF